MSTDIVLSAETMARMQEAAKRAQKGVRDPELMRKACEEMDRMREELKKRIGTVDVAVDFIRDARNR